MLNTGFFETRETKLIAAVAVVLAAAGILLSSAPANALPCDPTRQDCPEGGGTSQISYTLTVSSPSSGTITSSPTGINCGSGNSDCTEIYRYTVTCDEFDECTEPDYTTVTLTASGGPSGYAPNWSGSACSGTGPCTLTMNQDHTVSMTWVDNQNPTVSLSSPPSKAGPATSFTATASDNAGVSKVQFFVDGILRGEDTVAPYLFRPDLSLYVHGTAHTLTAQSVDVSGRQSGLTPGHTFTVDRQTSGAFGPPTPAAGSFTNSPQVAFTKDADVPAGNVFCATNSGSFSGCSSPYTPPTPSDGPYTVTVRLTDDVGNTATIQRSFTVDTTDPSLNITSGPNGQIFGPRSTQTWNFTAGDVTSGVQSVQCKVEAAGSSGTFGPCNPNNSSHSVSNLPGGTYTFRVRATDRAGNLSNLQTRTFSIDATAPETSITGGPSGTVNTNLASFHFSSEAGATFECKLDGAAFSACTSSKSYTALTNGRHTFSVRARDGAGNVDASPASRTWTVDTIKPTVVPISPRHASITRDTTPTIKATVKDNLTNLQKSNIKLYVSGTLVPATRYGYSASTDVLTYNSPRLAKGKKTVKIVATDAARNVGMKSWYCTIR